MLFTILQVLTKLHHCNLKLLCLCLSLLLTCHQPLGSFYSNGCTLSKSADDPKLSARGGHPEGPGQAGEIGWDEPHYIPEGQVQGAAPGSGQSQSQTQAGG